LLALSLKWRAWHRLGYVAVARRRGKRKPRACVCGVGFPLGGGPIFYAHPPARPVFPVPSRRPARRRDSTGCQSRAARRGLVMPASYSASTRQKERRSLLTLASAFEHRYGTQPGHRLPPYFKSYCLIRTYYRISHSMSASGRRSLCCLCTIR
jgi:hypothetical protein